MKKYEILKIGREIEFMDEDPDLGEHYIYVPFDVILEIAEKIKKKG